MIEIYDANYNAYVDIIGTAHFTRRSLNDAYEAISSLRPRDVAIELDWGRFRRLNAACATCPRRGSCRGSCEFIGATEALGNVDANVWLIDMTVQEMRHRMRMGMAPSERSYVGLSTHHVPDEDPVWLWEMGLKERVIDNSKREIEALRRVSPSVWRVLIDERNALMAARLAWIATKNLDRGKESKILTFVGAAHVDGIRGLLGNPLSIRESLRKFDLSFTEPTLIRRVAIRGD